MQNKQCKICKTIKPETMFYKNPSYSDGREHRCKECRKAYQRKWREDNRQHHREYSRQYYKDNQEERSAYYKQWCIDNAEHKAEYDRQWKKDNPEKTKDNRRVANARRRALLANAEGDYTPQEWRNLKRKYKNTCLKCGKKPPEVKITPDHVVPLASGGKNSIDNIQPLCWGCNAQKQNTYADYRQRHNQLS